MRTKVLWVVVWALAMAPIAGADVILTFTGAGGVNNVSFYSVEGAALKISVTTTLGAGSVTNLTTINTGVGGTTTLADTNITKIDFSGTPNFYVLDDVKYTAADGSVHTMTFDEFNLTGDQVGTFYSALAGGPTFNNLAQIYSEAWTGVVFGSLSPPPTSTYNYGDYPASSCDTIAGNSAPIQDLINLNPTPNHTCSVLFEGTVQGPTVPEPGSLALFGSGLIGLAGVLRRKLR